MRLLVCGGRDFSHWEAAYDVLDGLKVRYDIDIVIQGGAKGADTIAKDWAATRGVHYATVEALWDKYGKAAGYKRNSAMLILEPDLCVAFPGGKGTNMMIDLCEKNRIKVIKVL